MTLDESLAKAIYTIKNCNFKGKYVKVELEAQLNRSDAGYNCEDCDEGEVYDDDNDTYETCFSCGGDWENDNGDWSDGACKRFIEEHVSDEARDALVFGRFYRDGSVDSEYTFTLPLDKAKLVLEYIRAFKALSDEIGGGLETDGAGMHIAILNSPNGTYPDGNVLRNGITNFQNSMRPLLPALYFLGSASHESRGLSFRAPYINENHGVAISIGRKVPEFRFFETCYERPEAFLDFLCVIGKCMDFYRLKARPLPEPFGKIGDVGIKDGRGIHRFYFTSKHLDALEAGLKVLKPDHKSINQLKKERNFCVTKSSLSETEKKELAKWRSEWVEFKERSKYSRQSRIWKARSEYAMYCANGGTEYALAQLGTLEQHVQRSLDTLNAPTRITDYLRQKLNDKATLDVQYVVSV